jgi:hypothetical protein
MSPFRRFNLELRPTPKIEPGEESRLRAVFKLLAYCLTELDQQRDLPDDPDASAAHLAAFWQDENYQYIEFRLAHELATAIDISAVENKVFIQIPREGAPTTDEPYGISN